MEKYQFGCLFLVASQVIWAGPMATASPTNDWTGFYFGAKAGAVFSNFDTNTSTQAGSMFSSELANVVNHAGNQTINTSGFLSGIESGYNWQFNQFLFGLEADFQSLSTNGVKYSNAVIYDNAGDQFVITSYADNNWLLTARPRLGLVTNNWLLYGTGGLSLAYLRSDFLFSNSLGSGSFESQRVHSIKPGYVVGAGVETHLTHHVSLKAEYLFEDFNKTNASLMHQSTSTSQPFFNWMRLNANLISLGLNYHIDDQLAHPLLTPIAFDANHWKTEIGTRLFFSSGLAGTPQPLLNTSDIGNILASRLTFSGMSATSEEVFARIEHSSGVFVKGYLGAGSVSSGQLNDEDFPAGAEVYSNTLSKAWGNLSYATLDLGYLFLKNLFGSAGAFIGYNYYAQNYNIYGCKQLAGSSTCANPNMLEHFLALSEDDSFNSLRLGLASEFNLKNQWSLTSEAAYLPLIHFRGLDMHNARQLIGPETANRGDGAMLETILNYQLNNAWALGVGGRYWAWNMHNGHLLFDFLGEDELIKEPARFNAERYGVFLQVKYHAKPFYEISDKPERVNWNGLFIGGNLGGAWSNSYWSDPFSSTIGSTGAVNIAHFGNKIHSTGPLAGMDMYLNWQTGHLVYGVGGSISGADIRGENTIFSGIGGNNGQEKSHYIGTVVARLGTTLDRSLIYLNTGGAVLSTQYNITGNTGILNLGVGSQTQSTWGWTGGVGVEYALANSWNTSVEYDYIRIPNHNLSFPTVELINEQHIVAHQNMGIFKLGVNRKFG